MSETPPIPEPNQPDQQPTTAVSEEKRRQEISYFRLPKEEEEAIKNMGEKPASQEGTEQAISDIRQELASEQEQAPPAASVPSTPSK